MVVMVLAVVHVLVLPLCWVQGQQMVVPAAGVAYTDWRDTGLIAAHTPLTG